MNGRSGETVRTGSRLRLLRGQQPIGPVVLLLVPILFRTGLISLASASESLGSGSGAAPSAPTPARCVEFWCSFTHLDEISSACRV